MFKYALLLTSLLTTMNVCSADTSGEHTGWTLLAKNEQLTEYFRDGSGKVKKDGTRSMIIELVPSESNPDQGGSYAKIEVANDDCTQGIGSYTLYTLAGTFISKNDYVKGGASLGARAVDILCLFDASAKV